MIRPEKSDESSYVFISYSHKDSEYAFKLRDELEYNGFSTWIDTDLDRGTRWGDEIVSKIKECDALIVIMTPSSAESKFVKKEILLAESYNVQ